MTEPVSDPAYWSGRLAVAKQKNELHQSVFLCSKYQWTSIESVHRKLLQKLLKPEDRILDAGCGYGRLLDLLPMDWDGYYLGVDSSPEFIELAKEMHGQNCNKLFAVGDLSNLSSVSQINGVPFDWAICISVRPMIIRNLGQEAWDTMAAELKRVSNQVLFLEYTTDPTYQII